MKYTVKFVELGALRAVYGYVQKMEDGKMRAVRIILSVVVLFFFLGIVSGLVSRNSSKVDTSKEKAEPETPAPSPTATAVSAPTGRVPVAPKLSRFERSYKAIDGVDEAGKEGRSASATAKVAVGKAAKIAEAGHTAEERAKFEAVEASLAPEELQVRMDKLERLKEDLLKIRGNISQVKGWIANQADLRANIVRQHMNGRGKDAGVDAMRRRDVKAKDEAIASLEAQLEEFQTELRKATQEVSRLEESIRTSTKKSHSYEE